MNPVLFPDAFPGDAERRDVNPVLMYDRELRGNPVLSVVEDAARGMFRQGGMLNPGRLVDPSVSGVVGALDTAAEMVTPGPGIDAGLADIGRAREAYGQGDYLNALGYGVSGVVGAGADIPMLGIFAGPAARTANRAALQQAQEMAATGADRRAIWDATGWFQGADGMWRFEIDDSAARMGGPGYRQMMDEAQVRASNAPMRDVFQHDELYAAYPDLAALEMRLRPDMPAGNARTRVGDDLSFEMGHASAVSKDQGYGRSPLLHELQHAVQFREGYDVGGNMNMPPVQARGAQMQQETLAALRDDRAAIVAADPGNIAALRNIDAQIDKVMRDGPSYDHAAYRALTGELEARTVQERARMGRDERARVPPWETEALDPMAEYQWRLPAWARPRPRR